MYNYFNCNVDFLIDHSAMAELEIVAIISRQKEKTLQTQPPWQKKPKKPPEKPKNKQTKKLLGKVYVVAIKIEKFHQVYTVQS